MTSVTGGFDQELEEVSNWNKSRSPSRSEGSWNKDQCFSLLALRELSHYGRGMLQKEFREVVSRAKGFI